MSCVLVPFCYLIVIRLMEKCGRFFLVIEKIRASRCQMREAVDTGRFLVPYSLPIPVPLT